MRCMTCPGGQSPDACAKLNGITPLKSASTTVILLIELPLGHPKASDALTTEGNLIPFWKLGQSENQCSDLVQHANSRRFSPKKGSSYPGKIGRRLTRPFSAHGLPTWNTKLPSLLCESAETAYQCTR
jgi:hypothetical protein